MEIILTKDIAGLGFKNDTVTVKPGYGRNYLIPQGDAMVANTSNKKMVAENIKQAEHKAEKLKTAANEIAGKINGVTLEVKAKIGDSGKIFGAVTTLQLSDALKAKGVEVDRRKIAIVGAVKEAGSYTAKIDLHKEVKAELTFEVVGE